jgi:hypothetical protein
LAPSAAYLSSTRKMCAWSMKGGGRQKGLPVLSIEGCLGVCSLMFRGVAEGFMKSALVGSRKSGLFVSDSV